MAVETNVVVVLEIMQVLIFILSQRLCNIWVLDNIKNSLRLLLQLFMS